MIAFARKLAGDRRGATAIEYGLIAALLSVLIVGGLQVAGPAVEGVFTSVGNTMTPTP
ncbi:MAG TPA: Flp family type IVb pilin [Alphaproteobacteria bacterium]|nr:Flp family type IVb pilin [Alphaproteobacteria bacterium]